MSSVPKRHSKVESPATAPRRGRRSIIEGWAEAVTSDGRVRVVAIDGEVFACRVPAHISLPWLRAALVRGHVAAEVTVSETGGEASLWSLFPGPEHEAVVPENVAIAASHGIELVCGKSKITMIGKELRVRSRDVTVNGSRVTRVRGGTVKLN
jgi:hypothetical protein